MAEITGELFDGTSTAPQNVVLAITTEGLAITPHNGVTLYWPFSKITLITMSGATFHCSLQEKTAIIAPVLSFTDTTLFNELKARSRGTHHPFMRVINQFWSLKWWQTLIVVIILLVLFIRLFFLLLLNAYTITPITYDLRIGNKFNASVTKAFDRCSTSALDTFLVKAMSRLALPDDQFPHKVVILDSKTENAISIPGGTIYLFRGLLESSNSPDEILGVLSHEIVHAEKRHSVQQIINSMGIYYMSSLIIGMAIDGLDLLEGLESTLEMSSLLLTLQYSRRFERQADSLGIERLHRAGLKVGPLDSLLTRITPKPRGRAYLLSLLSTHPLHKERSERFNEARKNELFAMDTVFNFERKHWEEIKMGCPRRDTTKTIWKKVLRKRW